MATMNDRTISLIGGEAFKKLKESSVIVFGIGGVGGFCVEALGRAGVGKLALVDFDIIDITNINRQVCALHSTAGKYKVDVMKERLLDINPKIEVEIFKEKVFKDNIAKIGISGYNYISDAIDDVPAKILIIEEAYRNGVPIISSMGTGNKTIPSEFKVDVVSKTHTCPLAKKMRKELAKKGIEDVKVVYSTEKSHRADGEHGSPASISYMPATAGLLMASEIIKGIVS